MSTSDATSGQDDTNLCLGIYRSGAQNRKNAIVAGWHVVCSVLGHSEAMMRLTYWIAERYDDSRTYSIRGRRRKDVVEELKAFGLTAAGGSGDGATFSAVHKVVVEYADAYDLMLQAMSEGSLYEGE